MTFTFKSSKKQQKSSKKAAKKQQKTAKKQQKAAKKQQKAAKVAKKWQKSGKKVASFATLLSNMNHLTQHHYKFCLAFLRYLVNI